MSSSPLESGVGQRRQAKSDSLWRGLVFPLHQPPLSLLHSLARHACNMGCMNTKSSNFIYVGPTDRKGAWQSGPRYPAPRTGEQLDVPPIKSLESERGWLLRASAPPLMVYIPLVGEEFRTYRWGADPTESQQRLTVHDAARRLGISEDAVRMRVKRGTLSANKEGGRLYVLLDIEPTPEPTPDRTGELIEELRGRVLSLEHQLDQEREANRENRRIIVALTSRIPAIEAPSEERESPQTVEDEPERAEPQPVAGEAQGEAQESVHRPWWRRMFGG